MRHIGAGNWLLAGLVGLALHAAPAMAGNNNEVLVRQESPVGTPLGNTLSVDQSGATGGRLGGLDLGAKRLDELPVLAQDVLSGRFEAQFLTIQRGQGNEAIQRGEGNKASVTMTGAGGELQLYQSWDLNVGGGNVATMAAVGAALGGVIQIGELNTASLTVINGGEGLITQLGNKNTAGLTVGEGLTGSITQIGNANATGVVEVLGAASLHYIQKGNDLRPATMGLQLFTDANVGTVTIVQEAF